MACIEKMSICGIRSFSPDRDETIEFYSPLTMIVGANGCGKTTIIEALKFICTGALPPNSSKGQSFVNDPTVTDSTEVKANVKLRFLNLAGYPSVVTRSLQVIKKKTKLEFKSVDGVIKTTNARNEKVSSTQKCSDLDRMIPEMLAVSSPILENVIFCHQEDSNWPMQEGLALKKKFDDVFESTRYTKALEAIAKSKKEYADQVKDLKGELLELGAQLEAAKETKKEIAACEENAQSCQQELEDNQSLIERLEEKIRKSRDIIKEAQVIETSIKEMQIRVEESKRRISDKKNSLEILYDENEYTTAMLENKIATFDESLSQRSAEIATLQLSINKYQKEIKELRIKGDEVNILKGQAESTKQLLDNEFRKLKDESTQAVNQCGLNPTLVSPSWNHSTSKNLLQAIESKKSVIQKEGETSLVETRNQVTKYDTQLTDIQSTQQKIEIELNTKAFEQNKLMNEIQIKKNEIMSLSTARSNLQSVKGSYDNAKKTHDEMNDSYASKANEFKKLIKETGDQIHHLDGEITTLSNQQQELSAFRNEQASLTATERHLSQESTQLNNDLEVAVGTHHEALIVLAKQQQAQQQQSSSVISMTTLPPALIAAILSSASSSNSTSTSTMPASYSSYSSMPGLSSSLSLSAIAVQQILAHLKSPTELNALVTVLSQSSGDQSRALVREREQYQDIKSQRSGLEAVLKQVNDRLQSAQDKQTSLQMEEKEGILQCIVELNQLRVEYQIAGGDEDFNQPISAYENNNNNIDGNNSNTVINTTKLVELVNDVFEVGAELKLAEYFFAALKKSMAKLENHGKTTAATTARGGNNNSNNINATPSCCALCERSLSESTVNAIYTNNKEKLYKRFEKRAKMKPEEYQEMIEKCKQLLLRAQNLKHITQLIADVDDEINSLFIQKNDQITPRLTQLINDDTNMSENVKIKEKQVNLSEKAYMTLKETGIRWVALNVRQNEVVEKRKRSNQNSSLFMSGDGSEGNGSGSVRNLEELEDLQRALNQQKNECQIKEKKYMADEANLTKRFYNVKNNFNEKEREYTLASNQVEQLTKAEEYMKLFSHHSEELGIDLRSLQHQKEDITRQVESCMSQLKVARLQHQDREKALTQRVTDITTVSSMLQRLINTVQDLDTKYAQYNIRQLESQSQQYTTDIFSIENQIKALLPQLNKLTAELNSQEHTKKQVRGNIELRQNILTYESMMSELTQLEFKLNGDNDVTRKLRDAQRDYQRSEQEKTRLTTERDKLLGKIETYTQQASELQNKLEGRAYRGVEERFRKKTIDYEVTVMTVTDLGCYYDALDSALQNFHTLKVREINKIIRELWQLIYKGQDIDMIEIESGQENEAGGTATVKKRSYNYRVVMRKGDVPLDMRGRCSAGQKVLAAIVIRLALAETFCLSCGVLALDEPTTNLDEANKAGLAHALARIIIDRSSAAQSNFQLICITHDEDFVRLMNTELSGTSSISVPEYYFRVSREELNNSGKFFSRIDRVRWEDM